MADNRRWFKTWTTILTDPDLNSLGDADRWRWVWLGALVAQHGNKGRLVSRTGHLAAVLRCGPEEVRGVLARLPHVGILNGGDPTVEGEGKQGESPDVLGSNVDEFVAQIVQITHPRTCPDGSIVPPSSGNDVLIVTFDNWSKYQRDTTASERKKRYRLAHRERP